MFLVTGFSQRLCFAFLRTPGAPCGPKPDSSCPVACFPSRFYIQRRCPCTLNLGWAPPLRMSSFGYGSIGLHETYRSWKQHILGLRSPTKYFECWLLSRLIVITSVFFRCVSSFFNLKVPCRFSLLAPSYPPSSFSAEL